MYYVQKNYYFFFFVECLELDSIENMIFVALLVTLSF